MIKHTRRSQAEALRDRPQKKTDEERLARGKRLSALEKEIAKRNLSRHNEGPVARQRETRGEVALPGQDNSSMTILFDSTLVGYLDVPAHTALRQFVAHVLPQVSAVSWVEVLKFTALTLEDETYFRMWFADTVNHPITNEIIAQVITLRQ